MGYVLCIKDAQRPFCVFFLHSVQAASCLTLRLYHFSSMHTA